MADFNDQVIMLWDEWTASTGAASGDPADFVKWGLANRRLTLQPQDVQKLLRRQVTQALRQARRVDWEGGFTYRAKQSVTLFGEDGIPIKHYFDTDSGGTQTLRQKSVRERRDGIADDVYRAVCDTDRMNKVFSNEPKLNFVTDFTDDVAEARAAESAKLEDDEEAA